MAGQRQLSRSQQVATRPASDDATQRAIGIDLQRVLDRLWSGGGNHVVTTVGGRDDLAGYQCVEAFVALPSADTPRFLIPLAARSAMASILSSYAALRRPRTRLARRVLAAASRAGVVGRLVGHHLQLWLPAGLDDAAIRRHAFPAHLRHELDEPRALVALGVHQIDPHYKPTVQLFTAAGRPLGFAKIGWTAATGVLVRQETTALQTWARDRGTCGRVLVPGLRCAGSWDGQPYLVTRPLPAAISAVADADPLADAAREVAGALVSCELRGSPYWAMVQRRFARAARAAGGARGALVVALRRAIAVVERESGDRQWTFGRWHGDWAAWNVGRTREGLYVWDWEHSTPRAPWGFDLIHWQVTVPHLRRGIPYETCVSAAARSALLPQVLVTRHALLLAYLIEMGLRSLEVHDPSTTVEPGLYPGLAQRLSAVATAVTAAGST